jgi:hypothetical protein
MAVLAAASAAIRLAKSREFEAGLVHYLRTTMALGFELLTVLDVARWPRYSDNWPERPLAGSHS